MSKIILIITDNLPEQVNGVVTTYKNIEALAILDGYRVLYLDPRQFLHFGCPGYPEVKLSLPWQIGKKIEALAPDHIHIATEGPIGLCARLWLDQRGYRYNTAYHTKFPEFLNQIYHIPTAWTYNYVRWFHKHSGKVMTTTANMARDLAAEGFENVIAWTRGVDRTNLQPTKARMANRETTLLSVGRISKEKGLDDLIALQWEFDVVIVGDGPYRSELESKMPAAQFLGYKSGGELADLYQQADVFVFPSRTDTFGLVMIESMSLGTPVAAYPVRGPLDVIEPGVTGIMDDNLYLAVKSAMQLDRTQVKAASSVWTWEACWKIFKDNLIRVR